MKKSYEIVTFDCYGTLIDWEAGIGDSFRAAAREEGVALERDAILRVYHQVEPTIQAAEYLPYRDVLAATAIAVAERLDWHIDRERASFLAASLPAWPPFIDTNSALERLKRDGYTLGILSNVDADLLAGTLRNLSVEFDFLVTAEQVRSYKPAHGHFRRAREIVGKRAWLHAAQSWFHDVVPACELGIPVAWVNRKDEPALQNAHPQAEVATLAGLLNWVSGEP
jgi:2-haloalkanoic acid dehalogenase type II